MNFATSEERDARREQVRAETRKRVTPILRGMAGKPAIDIALRIGSVCPFTTKDDCATWTEEIHLMEQEEKSHEYSTRNS